MSDAPVIPRMAAAVIVLRDGPDGPEVLVGQRTPQARFMGGFWVFPGGRVDPGDGEGEAAWPVAAAREVREEVGIDLLAADLCPYDRWVTPEPLPRRYDTVFFLARAPQGAQARVDGEEIVASRWATAERLLRDSAAGTAILAFPTLRQLESLAPYATVADAMSACPEAHPKPTLPIVSQRDGDHVLSIPGPDGRLVHYRSGTLPAGERPPS